MVVTFVLPLAALADATFQPGAVWRSTGRSKSSWLTALAATSVLTGIGLLVALAYFGSQRPRLMEVRKGRRLTGRERAGPVAVACVALLLPLGFLGYLLGSVSGRMHVD